MRKGASSPFGSTQQRFWPKHNQFACKPILDTKITLLESSFDNRDKKEEPLPDMNMTTKLYPTKAYTFGVSRGDAVKVHVGEVYQAA